MDEGSNPSDSTFKQLIFNKLQNQTDQNADENSQVRTKWKWPKLYEPPSPTGDWFVWFKYRHPQTGAFVRFKFFKGFSDYDTKTAKRSYGRDLVVAIKELLKEGWSPFDEQETEIVDAGRPVSFLIHEYLNKLDVRPRTKKKYETELNLFKTWLIKNHYGSLPLSQITKTIVTNFLESHKSERNWSGKTYNHYLNDITTFFNYYHENFDDIVPRVPTKSLKRKRVDRPGNKAFNDYEFKRLKELMLENGDHLLYYFCSFVYYATLRNEAEARFIKAGDFNFKTKTLKIDSGTAKNRRTEFIPIYPEFLELLYELGIDKMPADHYVFGKLEDKRSLSIKKFVIGAPYTVGEDFFARKFRKYKSELSLSIRDGIYCYKHTRAVHLGEDGEDLYKIMKLMRHRDLATTMIYLRDLGINTQGHEFNKGRKF
ncbi:tyrosine-type recombinase/integrase [Parapedobacter lycopersici]|uniref:tyrosine-type recombinase/integrase n=1 Tax=Parapedobacter lycopersici TaxID=1864939 RepID=UPI00214D3037|nr:site-specific integrase [Parapedobacter lycopersici]